jgi:poly(hydroxyalkanoate) granule-associated protein
MPTPAKPKVEEATEQKDKYQSQMAAMMRKMMLATIGAVAMAQEEIEAFVNRLVERGEIAERDGRKMIKEMREKRKHQAAKMEDEVNKNVKDVLERMNIPTKSDIDEVSQKVTALSKKIDDLKKTP